MIIHACMHRRMASSTREWPKVTSSHHRNRYCGPCVLCKKMQPRYYHYCSLTSSEQSFLNKHHESTIANGSCICRSHVVEAKRQRSDPEYIPAWKQSGQASSNPLTVVPACMYTGCLITEGPLITPSKDTKPIFAEALNVTGTISLCETHYQMIYRQSHKPDPCAGCGAMPKAREGAYTRHSPDAETVSQYLSVRTGTHPDLTPDDTLCKGCYDMHWVILNHMEQQQTEPSTKLKACILVWNEKLKDEINTNETTRAILTSVIYVARKLQQDRALLPQAVTVFLDKPIHQMKNCTWSWDMEKLNFLHGGYYIN